MFSEAMDLLREHFLSTLDPNRLLHICKLCKPELRQQVGGYLCNALLLRGTWQHVATRPPLVGDWFSIRGVSLTGQHAAGPLVVAGFSNGGCRDGS